MQVSSIRDSVGREVDRFSSLSHYASSKLIPQHAPILMAIARPTFLRTYPQNRCARNFQSTPFTPQTKRIRRMGASDYFRSNREAIDASSISKTVQACLVNRGSHVRCVSGAPTSLAFTSGDIIPCRIPCRPACSPAGCHRCSGNGFRNGTALHSAAQHWKATPRGPSA